MKIYTVAFKGGQYGTKNFEANYVDIESARNIYAKYDGMNWGFRLYEKEVTIHPNGYIEISEPKFVERIACYYDYLSCKDSISTYTYRINEAEGYLKRCRTEKSVVKWTNTIADFTNKLEVAQEALRQLECFAK